MTMETALVDGISKVLGVPRPFVHEENQAFTLIEDWKQLAIQVVNEPIHVKPLGYYRSPESVDMYVIYLREMSQPMCVGLLCIDGYSRVVAVCM